MDVVNRKTRIYTCATNKSETDRATTPNNNCQMKVMGLSANASKGVIIVGKSQGVFKTVIDTIAGMVLKIP